MPNWSKTTHNIEGKAFFLPTPNPRRVLAAGTTVNTPAQEAVYNTNWSDFSASQYVDYHKDALGFVRIQGCVKRSSSMANPGGGSAAEVIFTLPVQYRPDQIITYSNCTDSNSLMTKVVVYPTDYATSGLRGAVQVAADINNYIVASTATYLMLTFQSRPQGNY